MFLACQMLAKQMRVKYHLAKANVLLLVTPESRLLSLAESPVVIDNVVVVGADGSLGVRVHDDGHVTIESGNVSSLGSSHEDPMRILRQVRRFRVGPLFRTDGTPRIPVPAICRTIVTFVITKAHLKRQQIVIHSDFPNLC